MGPAAAELESVSESVSVSGLASRRESASARDWDQALGSRISWPSALVSELALELLSRLESARDWDQALVLESESHHNQLAAQRPLCRKRFGRPSRVDLRSA